MIYLILCIILSSALLIIFKYFEKYNIDTFQAIVVNYFIAALCGFIFDRSGITANGIIEQEWFLLALLMGILFISIFTSVAYSAQQAGVSVTVVAMKMSVVIPVVLAVVLYDEKLNAIKTGGIILALISIWLTSKREGSSKINMKYFFLPLVVFFGSGIIDSLVNHAQKEFIRSEMAPLFISSIFLSAAAAGTAALAYRHFSSGKKPGYKNFIGGIVLGVVNYFTMEMIFRALDSGVMPSSLIFTVNNMSIVALSAVAAYILFKEKLSASNWAGIVLAVISIAVIALS
jgi:drug/metabolite transporter (DMT)-like permease